MQQPGQWQYLLQQYLEDRATDEERRQLFSALQRQDIDWEELLLQAGLQQPADADYAESDWNNIIAQIMQQPVQKRRVFFMNRWWMAAACVVFAVCCLWFIVSRNKVKQEVAVTTPVVHDIMPGKQGAILTLADGRQVVIDSAGNGNIAQQGNMLVTERNGELVYSKEEERKKNNEEGKSPLAYNMLSTPRGRQFELVLPDGSKVWLNAASSIRYPVSFAGNERVVEITGEAYFEVEPLRASSGQKVPFVVSILSSTGGPATGRIEVLGTHFNVNAYTDEEAVKTTLLEGRVKVSTIEENNKQQTSNYKLLSPGQQAVFSSPTGGGREGAILVQDVDAEASIAWKKGFFNFQDASLQQVMRQLARWYDIDIKYEAGVPNVEFGGKMGRDLTLSNVLHFLEKSGLHCQLENNHTLIVKP